MNTAVTMKSLRKTKKWFSSASIQIVNGTPFERYGWVSKEYVVLDPPYYIANHPSPVLATPQDDAKILCWLNTYDALRVIGEAEDFYIVSLHGAAGFMKKE